MYRTNARTSEAEKLNNCWAGLRLGTIIPIVNKKIIYNANVITYLNSREKKILTNTMPIKNSVNVFFALCIEYI